MTAEKYLVCDKCRKRVYVCKKGRLENRPAEMEHIAAFLEHHEYDCDGPIHIQDESYVNYDYENFIRSDRSQ